MTSDTSVRPAAAPGAAGSFHYGRRSPKNAPALALGPLLTGVLPSPPPAVDFGTDFTGWQMLGNNAAGDCVAVTWANQRALVTTALSHATSYPDQAQVWSFYRTQNPNFDPNGNSHTDGPGSSADRGMDIQTALEYLTNTGGPDGVRAVAFAKVDFTNENELRSAHAIFGQVWYGINVLWANQTEFGNGQPWDYVPTSGVDGGHSVTGVGYDPTDYRFITWAVETEWTEAFRSHQVEEAWVVIWPEHLGSTEFEQGISLTQLAADYQAITGSTLVVPQSVQRIGVLTTAGEALVKEGGLSTAWVDEYPGVAQVVVSPNRVGVLTTSGDALVKEGGLSTTWVTEYTGVTQVQVTDNRIAVLTSAGDALVKEGGLSTGWVTEYSGVAQLVISPNRVGVLTTSGDALVKEGGLSTTWVTEYTGVTQVQVTDNRIAVLTAAGDALVKEGGLSTPWVTEYSGVAQLVISPNRVGVLTTSGDALVKEGGLSTTWVTEYTGVTQLQVTDNRIAVLTAAGDALVKEGGLSTAWITEYTGVTAVAIV